MSYYDGTVAYYDKQIAIDYEKIEACKLKIQKLEDDIAELRQLRVSVEGVGTEVENARNKTSRTIENLPMVIATASAVIKMSFFERMTDALDGPEKKKAIEGIENALRKIDQMISGIEKEIQAIDAEAQKANSHIGEVKQQKKIYIANKEKEIAEQMAKRKAAEEATKSATAAEKSGGNELDKFVDIVKKITKK